MAGNSTSLALRVGSLALDLGPGDTLWTVPNIFVASANCGRYCGGNVDFVAFDPDFWNLSVLSLRNKLIKARRACKLPKVMLPIQLAVANALATVIS